MKKKLMLSLALVLMVTGVSYVSAATMSEYATLANGQSINLTADMGKTIVTKIDASFVRNDPVVETTVQRKTWYGSWKNKSQGRQTFTTTGSKAYTTPTGESASTRTIWANVESDSWIEATFSMSD